MQAKDLEDFFFRPCSLKSTYSSTPEKMSTNSINALLLLYNRRNTKSNFYNLGDEVPRSAAKMRNVSHLKKQQNEIIEDIQSKVLKTMLSYNDKSRQKHWRSNLCFLTQSSVVIFKKLRCGPLYFTIKSTFSLDLATRNCFNSTYLFVCTC